MYLSVFSANSFTVFTPPQWNWLESSLVSAWAIIEEKGKFKDCDTTRTVGWLLVVFCRVCVTQVLWIDSLASSVFWLIHRSIVVLCPVLKVMNKQSTAARINIKANHGVIMVMLRCLSDCPDVCPWKPPPLKIDLDLWFVGISHSFEQLSFIFRRKKKRSFFPPWMLKQISA